MARPRSRTNNKKHTERNGRRNVNEVDSFKGAKKQEFETPKEREKRKRKAREREEKYWASKSGPVTTTYLPGFEPKEK